MLEHHAHLLADFINIHALLRNVRAVKQNLPACRLF